MNNVDIAKKCYQAFAEGNLEAVLAAFHPDIVWDECQSFPFITGTGKFVGPEAIVQGVFAHIPDHYQGFHIEIAELFGSGDKVVMVGHYRGVWKATGKSFNANSTHVWTFKEGKAIHFFQAVDTAEIINP